jgi:hypothetical protein
VNTKSKVCCGNLLWQSSLTLLARWWRSRAFWLVWAGYLAFVAESAVLATLHAFLLSSLNNLNNLLEGLRL